MYAASRMVDLETSRRWFRRRRGVQWRRGDRNEVCRKTRHRDSATEILVSNREDQEADQKDPDSHADLVEHSVGGDTERDRDGHHHRAPTTSR